MVPFPNRDLYILPNKTAVGTKTLIAFFINRSLDEGSNQIPKPITLKLPTEPTLGTTVHRLIYHALLSIAEWDTRSSVHEEREIFDLGLPS